MNRNESRYFNTARKMDDALIALLGQRDLTLITVKDICQTAGVNRSTFYLHYETVGDLLDETLEELNDRFASCFAETPEQIRAGIAEAPLGELVFVREKYLVPYLGFIRDNRTVFSAAVRQSRALRTDQQFEALYRYCIDPVMERFRVPKEVRGYYNAFFMFGILAVIREWLKNGCKEEPEAVSKLIEGFVIREKPFSR